MNQNPERFRLIDEVFRAALRLPADERAALLAQRCAGDSTLLAEIEGLLAEDACTAGALDHPVMGENGLRLSGLGLRGPHTPEPVPEHIGRYRVIARIGSGGMGTVYEAEQENPRRQVAVKVINHGIASAAMLRRFEFEAHLLGRLQHPGIAQIFEAGVQDTPRGPRPYFAMELIRGRPLIAYANDHRLSTRARLRLIATLADAVHHAHQRGVIHRDLKPANILVDESGQPRILDFGVARAVDADVQTTTAQTDAGQLVGTVAYMSPEQAGGNPNDLDTRSDVYALGVVAYELLSGQLPYELRGRSLHDAVRIIRETEPTPITTTDRTLRGDVQTIVGKALEKDKTRRYDSASAFAEDVRRFLTDQPIAARPPSAVYQLRKFASRHRALVVAATIVAVTLIGAMSAVSLALRDAQSQRRIAERKARTLQDVNSFLARDLLVSADPWQGGDKDVTLLGALRASADKIDTRFADDPDVAGTLHQTFGETFRNLQEFERAERHLRAALDKTGDPDASPGLVADRSNELAFLLMDVGRFDEAAEVLALAADTLVARTPGDHQRISTLLNSIASVEYKQGHIEQAEGTFVRALHHAELAPDDEDGLMATLASLALTRQRLGRLEEAEPMSRRAVEAHRRTLGDEHPDTLTVVNNLALLLTERREYAEAEQLNREVLSVRMRTLGPDHVDTCIAMSTLARLLIKVGRHAEAEPLAVKSSEGISAALGAEHPYAKIADTTVKRLYKEWPLGTKVPDSSTEASSAQPPPQ